MKRTGSFAAFRRAGLLAGIAASVVASAPRLAAQTPKGYRGAIIESVCTTENGDAPFGKNAKGTGHCFVLSNPQMKTVYRLDNQEMPRAFYGHAVIVAGTLNADTSAIHVDTIVQALPAKLMQAKSVYIDCQNCVRAMSKVKLVALQQMLDWGRFKAADDRRQADLIFLFGPNPYLGDYLTRDRPDTRPVNLQVTYLDVLDPGTGKSLWGDARREGSWREAGATKDLLEELRAHMEAQDGNVARLLLHYKHWNEERGAGLIHETPDGGK